MQNYTFTRPDQQVEVGCSYCVSTVVYLAQAAACVAAQHVLAD
jgi:hypothetical protein